MAGKVIIETHTMFGKAKTKIFVNGEERFVMLGGEKETFDIDADVKIVAKVYINPKNKEVIARNNEVTKLIVTKVKGKMVTEVISITPIEQYADEPEDDAIYNLRGARGRKLKVYEDKCIITTEANVISFVTGNGSDGEKTIYYSDVLGVQFKRSGIQLGYLQLETASSSMNNKSDNFFNENSFTFDSDLDVIMEDVQKFVKQKVDEAKKQKNAPIIVAGTTSNADEIKKFKELLDAGIITQEEFDAKKKQLLGL